MDLVDWETVAGQTSSYESARAGLRGQRGVEPCRLGNRRRGSCLLTDTGTDEGEIKYKSGWLRVSSCERASSLSVVTEVSVTEAEFVLVSQSPIPVRLGWNGWNIFILGDALFVPRGRNSVTVS